MNKENFYETAYIGALDIGFARAEGFPKGVP